MLNRKYPLTVLLSVFNAGKYLDRCFTCLAKQTYSDFCLLCIDDASTDTSPRLLRYWQKQFGRARMIIITNPVNRGLTLSLNTGLAGIHTPFTARIDADDWWLPAKLAKQMTFMSQYPDYGIVGCNYFNLINNKPVPATMPETDTAIRKSIVAKNPFAHSCVLFRTAVIKQVGDYDSNLRYGQDYDLWFRCLPHTRLFNLQAYLCYRNTDSGISLSKRREQMLQCVKTQFKYIAKYHYPPLSYLYVLDPLTNGFAWEPLRKLVRLIKSSLL